MDVSTSNPTRYALVCVLGSSALAQDFGSQQIISTLPQEPKSIYAYDLDGDGDKDVLTASWLDDRIAWFENLGEDTFGNLDFGGMQTISDQASGAKFVRVADLDGDGDGDVLSASSMNNTVAWYENLGPDSFGTLTFSGPHEIHKAASLAKSLAVGDLDGDGDPDVVTASLGDDRIAWFENLGGGQFGPEETITTLADGANSVHLADLDGDLDLDVLSASRLDNKVAWYPNVGAGNGVGGGTFGAQQVITSTLQDVFSVEAGDLDGDADMDVLAASKGRGAIVWFENLGAGSFGPARVITMDAKGARCVFASDLDADHDLDVLSASWGDSKIAWYRNLGGGNFGAQEVISTEAAAARSVYAADLDGDGDMEVLSASTYDDKIAWYANLMGPFDCNGNGVWDSRDIDNGVSFDCNGNGVPDECDVAADPTIDLNLNDVPDACEPGVPYWIYSHVTGNWYAATDQADVNLAAGYAARWKGYLTAIGSLEENAWLGGRFGDAQNPIWIGLTDLALEGTFEWLNGEEFVFDDDNPAPWRLGEPDNKPGLGADFVILYPPASRWLDEPAVPPGWPLPRGVVELESTDCDGNGQPDVYEVFLDGGLDCDGNGIHDHCDLAGDPSLDCDGNWILDECELKDRDCNGNGILDSCDIESGFSTDCNANDIPDSCDLDNGGPDCNGNRILDDCDIDCDNDRIPDDCDAIGENLCPSVPNSSGQAAHLSARGGTCVGLSTAIEFTVEGLPKVKMGVFLISVPGGPRPTFPFFTFGTLCVDQPIRLAQVPAGTQGSFSYTLDLEQLPPGVVLLPGETRVFQMLFRDSISDLAPYLSDALEVTFQ